jgi:hypothetical protein
LLCKLLHLLALSQQLRFGFALFCSGFSSQLDDAPGCLLLHLQDELCVAMKVGCVMVWCKEGRKGTLHGLIGWVRWGKEV